MNTYRELEDAIAEDPFDEPRASRAALYIDRPIDVKALTLAPMRTDMAWLGAALANHR